VIPKRREGDILVDDELIEVFRGYHARRKGDFVIEGNEEPPAQDAPYGVYHCRQHMRALLIWLQDADELTAWLSEHILPQGHSDEYVNAAAYQRLRDLGIEPPTPDRLERVLASASSAFEERFCTVCSPTPPRLGRQRFQERKLHRWAQSASTPPSARRPRGGSAEQPVSRI
jgi:hypothetical protein